MTRDKEAQLFDYLCRHKPLREWLEGQLKRHVSVLMVNADHAALMKAQGACAFINAFLDRINAAEESAKRQ